MGTGPLQVLAATLTLFQPEGEDYAHQITTSTPGFADLPSALVSELKSLRCTDSKRLLSSHEIGYQL